MSEGAISNSTIYLDDMMFRTDIDPSSVARFPYAHVATHDALQGYAEISAEFPKEGQFGKSIRMHGDLTYPDPQYVQLIERSEAWRRLHHYVYSSQFIHRFIELFRTEIEDCVASGDMACDPFALPIRPEPFEGREMIGRSADLFPRGERFLFPRFDIGIGRQGYGLINGGNGIHVDNATRIISALVYIGDNPTMVGGEHCLYELRDRKLVQTHSYSPAPNFLIASLQTNSAYHAVNPVEKIEGVRQAIYFAVSCSHEIWRPTADRRLQKLTRNRYRQNLGEIAFSRAKKIFNALIS